MKKLKVSQIQFEAKPTPYENAKILSKYYKKTLIFKPDLICTPECSNIITNNRNHLFYYSTFQEECPILKMSQSFAASNKVSINIGSLLLKTKNGKKLVNRSFFINKDGKIKATYDKIHMFDVKINKHETYKESNSFSPGNKIVLCKINNIKLGFTICYDLRFPNLFRKLAKKGAQIILMPAAFTVPTGKAHWEILIKARAIENSLFVLATNMCGNHHSNRKTYGHSMVCNPWGLTINQAKSRPTILNSILNILEIKKTRNKIPSILND